MFEEERESIEVRMKRISEIINHISLNNDSNEECTLRVIYTANKRQDYNEVDPNEINYNTTSDLDLEGNISVTTPVQFQKNVNGLTPDDLIAALGETYKQLDSQLKGLDAQKEEYEKENNNEL